MKIRYSRPFSIAFLVIGPLLVLTAALSETAINYVSGGVLTLLGLLMLVMPLVVISAYEVRVKTPAGLTVGTYPVRFPGDLALVGKKLWHVPTGRKIVMLGIAAHRPDVEQLQRVIAHQAAQWQQGPAQGRPMPQGWGS